MVNIKPKIRLNVWLLIKVLLVTLLSLVFVLISLRLSSDPSKSTYNSIIDNLNYIFNQKFDIKLWSSDFHISPVHDIKNIIKKFESSVIDKSLSAHCYLTLTCEKDLQIINQDNGIDLRPCPNQLKTDFFDYYKDNEEFNSVDAYLCTHAASLCELFMPFNKPLIVIASTRYEIGRHTKNRWLEWNKNLRLISQKPYNVIAANNKYDLVIQIMHY